MIATGGLLRINARRQDSLRSKPHKPPAHKRKNKKKRRSEVVVVKGKLKLCSVAGLVAALGVLVLFVGVVMAALGYWPREGLFFSARPQEGTAMASVSSPGPTPALGLGGEPEQVVGDSEGEHVDGGADESLNRTDTLNVTMQTPPLSFLEDFLNRYLYSDRLKVLGPLIMGIGIFLFICANAVLHENRDKKTKVISLRDIYSTVIDLHSTSSGSALRSSTNPINGLVNYVQSKNLEVKPRMYPASLSRRDGGGGGGGGGGAPSCQLENSRGAEGAADAVFSVYQEQQQGSPPASSPSSHRLPLPQSFSPSHLSACWTSFQKEALSSFTLPLRRPRSAAPHRRHSARDRTSQDRRRVFGEEEEQRTDTGGQRDEEEQYESLPPPLSFSTPPPHSALLRDAPEGSQTRLLLSSSSLTPSHLSLSSLSHLLYCSSSTPAQPLRRRSLPSASIAAGYTKLTHGEDQSFESTSSHQAMVSPETMMSEELLQSCQRRYSNEEKLRMISQLYSGQKKEEGEEEEEEEEAGQPIRS